MGARYDNERGRWVVDDPLVVVTDENGETIMALTLWEWVGRAIVQHHLPLDSINGCTIHLDGTEVLRAEG